MSVLTSFHPVWYTSVPDCPKKNCKCPTVQYGTASAMEGSKERMCAGREAWGEARYHYFGGVRSKDSNKN